MTATTGSEGPVARRRVRRVLLAGAVAVVVVIGAGAAIGATRPARAVASGGTGTIYWAETPDSSLLRFVVDGSHVKIAVLDSCVAGPLNTGTAAITGSRFTDQMGSMSPGGGDVDTLAAHLVPAAHGGATAVAGTLTVWQFQPEVEGKQGSEDTCRHNNVPFVARPVAAPSSLAPHLTVVAGALSPRCTIGGNAGKEGACGGVAAARVALTNPVYLTTDDRGDLYFTDEEDSPTDGETNNFGSFVEEFTAGGMARVVPGAVQLNQPGGVAVDAAGNLYVADAGANTQFVGSVPEQIGGVIMKITPAGRRTVIAGNYNFCEHPPVCGDGGPATRALLTLPGGLAVAPDGDLIVADSGDNEVREISPSGIITRIAGDGEACTTIAQCGDGGPALDAKLAYPTGIAVNAAGDIFVAEAGDLEVQEITPAGRIERILGSGESCDAFLPVSGNCGDGGPATAAELMPPADGNCVLYPNTYRPGDAGGGDDGDVLGVALDAAGDLYVTDCDELIKVNASGTVERLVGGWPLPCAGASCPGGPDAASDIVTALAQGVAVHGSTVYFGDAAYYDDGANNGYILSLKT